MSENTLKTKKKEKVSYLKKTMEKNIKKTKAVKLVKKDKKRNIKAKIATFESDSDDGMTHTEAESTKSLEMEASTLFESYRAIGYITSSTPFYIHKNEEDRLMTVSVDHAFHVYNLDKLRLVYISGSLKQKILQMQTHKNTFTLLSNNSIVKWRRMHIEMVYNSFTSEILQFLAVGDILIVLCEDKKLYVIEQQTGFIRSIQTLDFEAYYFMHPVSYLNKIILAGEGNSLQIYNIEAQKAIYNFKNVTKKLNGARILTIEQSPLVDIVALGLESGDILIANLKQDKIITTFSQDSPVKSLSFSTDASLEKSLLAS